MTEIEKLQQRLQVFADKRDWNQFHSPKNLSMALSVEVAELLEHFQWRTDAESKSLEGVDREAVAMEIADIESLLQCGRRSGREWPCQWDTYERSRRFVIACASA